jgi:Xaa-Pro aminopeptidase
MHAITPTLRLGRDVWDRDAMPIEEFADRAARLRAGMAPRGLDALLLFGSGLDACGHPTYISNYIVKLPFTALVVLPRDGEPALMFEGAARGRSAAQATTWIDDVRPCWNMADTCLAVLKDRNLLDAAIGLAAMPRLLPHAEWTTLAAGLPRARLVDAEDLVWECRTVKSAREVRQVQRASAIVRSALDSVASSAQATEMSLAADVFRDARRRGAEDIRMMVAALRDRNRAFRPPEAQRIVDGERLAVMFRASRERYWSETTRTFTVRGDRIEPVVDETLQARFNAAVERARSGAPIASLVDRTVSALTTDERRALEQCGFGHGIGVTADEPPTFEAGNQTPIEPGMCLVLTAAASSADGLALHADTIVIMPPEDRDHPSVQSRL